MQYNTKPLRTIPKSPLETSPTHTKHENNLTGALCHPRSFIPKKMGATTSTPIRNTPSSQQHPPNTRLFILYSMGTMQHFPLPKRKEESLLEVISSTISLVLLIQTHLFLSQLCPCPCQQNNHQNTPLARFWVYTSQISAEFKGQKCFCYNYRLSDNYRNNHFLVNGAALIFLYDISQNVLKRLTRSRSTAD